MLFKDRAANNWSRLQMLKQLCRPKMKKHRMGSGSLRFLDIRFASMADGCLCVAHPDRERERIWREMLKNSLGNFSVAGMMHPFGGK
jgi:hypothetical protein